MNRSRLMSQVVLYLAALFAIFICALGLPKLLPLSWQTRGAVFLAILFLIVCAGAVLCFARWKETVSLVAGVLEKMDAGEWNAPLPSSTTVELWSAISVLHQVRESLHSKFSTLQDEKEKLTRILSNLREGIIVSDPANRIAVANEAAHSTLRVQAHSLLGKSLDTLLDGNLKPILQSLIRGEEKSETISLGPETTIFFRTFLLKNAEDALIAKAAVVYDISESKRLDEMRKAFVANASHELRSPAAGLQALMDASEVGGLDDPDQRKKFIGMMKREIVRLNAIIRDLLDLSQLEREKEFSRQPLNLVELFQGWLEFYNTQLLEKKIDLSTRIDQQTKTIYGSSEDLEKLFRNLFENALKYTPVGGSIEVGLKQTEGQVLGWIKDSGIGISKEHLTRIFERFYRVDKSRSRALGGTGLGLSIARHAVERHGGKIWVESEENQGSTFFFSIPLTQS